MIDAVGNLFLVFIAVGCTIVWIVGLVNWDGEKNCDGDCKSCPFPPCNSKEK